MLNNQIELHVSIESPNGERDWIRCQSLLEVRRRAADWPAGTRVEVNMVQFGIDIPLTVTENGTLI